VCETRGLGTQAISTLTTLKRFPSYEGGRFFPAVPLERPFLGPSSDLLQHSAVLKYQVASSGLTVGGFL
jgi:hypothetical protein